MWPGRACGWCTCCCCCSLGSPYTRGYRLARAKDAFIKGTLIVKGMRDELGFLAFTRIDLVMALFVSGLVAVLIVLPARNRVKARSQRIQCTDNLKQIALAFKTSALGPG